MAERNDKIRDTAQSYPTPVSKPTWNSLARMTTPRGHAGSVCMNNGHQFLVIGGYKGWYEYWTGAANGVEFHSTCEYYDTRTKVWKLLPIDMPTGRQRFGVATNLDGNRVFVMGGNNASRKARSDLISIDLSSEDGCGDCDLSTLESRSWEILAPMMQPRAGFACVSHENYIYAFGGSGSAGTAEKYNIETNEWTPLPNIPCIQSNKKYIAAECTAGVVGDRIFVFGRSTWGKAGMWSVVFDTTKQKWELQAPNRNSATSTAANEGTFLNRTIPELNTKRWGSSVVSVDRSLIIIGGEDSKCRGLSTIEVLLDNTHSAVWNYAPTSMKYPRFSAVAGFLKETNELIVAGGSENDYDDIPPDGISDSIVWDLSEWSLSE